MIGKVSLLPEISSISLIHPPCDSTVFELWLKLCESAELGGADGGIIFWVREQDNPLVTDELVEVDWALGGLGLEVGCDGSQSEAGGEGVSR